MALSWSISYNQKTRLDPSLFEKKQKKEKFIFRCVIILLTQYRLSFVLLSTATTEAALTLHTEEEEVSFVSGDDG